jgi:hypothetical protein
MRFRATLGAICLALIPAIAAASDPIHELELKLRSGDARLQFDAKRGYLDSLLRALDIPVSSQTLVFSKTSLQSEHISPQTPRAIYFNDDVYVAWVQGSKVLEIMSVDSEAGAGFYALAQEAAANPEFERSTGHECSVCHYVQAAAPKFVPKLMMSSIVPDATGNVEGAFPFDTTDRSPMNERWGGWYVSGTHGNQKHLGNIVLKSPASPFSEIPAAEVQKAANITDLSTRFDSAVYPSPHSDIVALMVLAHQTEVQNLIAVASKRIELEPNVTGEPLVQAMLFAGAEPLTAAIRGSSNFASEFTARGPRDSHGRSLRDFDLQTRLFRYPLSYLIYSKAFDGMPDDVRAYVYRRLREILTGQDKSKDFAHLTSTDRAAILEILHETKPDFR